MEKIRGVDLLLFDGTFWSDDEFPRIKGSGETAHEMGHIPVEESLRLMQRVQTAMTDRKWDQVTAAANELADTLFYLEDA